MLKEILKKVNRILVETICTEKRISRLENKIDQIAKDKDVNNRNAVEEAFNFNTISSVNELEQFERELKNDFYENGKCFFIHNN